MNSELAEKIQKRLARLPMSCAIIDGDSGFTEVLVELMSGLGFVVSEFETGVEFSEVYENYRFDVVMITWNTDGFSGAQVIAHIESMLEPYPSIVVMFEDNASISVQLSISPIGFLFKPFDSNRVMTLIWGAIGE